MGGTTDRDGQDDLDQEGRIEELRRRVQETASGEMVSWESDTLTPDQREQFWRRVLESETAPYTTDFQQLLDTGVALPEPELVTDDELSSTLSAVIEGLADLGVFLSETDHLSDRELYTALWRDVLREEVPAQEGPGGIWHVSLLGGQSEEDILLYLKYYADDEWRQTWLTEFPDYPMPAHEDPAYDRDRHLPTPYA